MNQFLTTNEVAKIFRTSSQVIRQSRVSGMLFGQPAPLYRKMGKKKYYILKKKLKNLFAI